MKKILQIVLFLLIGGLSLLSCQNEGKVSSSEPKKEGGLSAFLNNTDMWNYLYENQFVSDIDSSIFTFKNSPCFWQRARMSPGVIVWA